MPRFPSVRFLQLPRRRARVPRSLVFADVPRWARSPVPRFWGTLRFRDATWLSQRLGRNRRPLALAASQNPFVTREQLAPHVQAPGLPPPRRRPCGRGDLQSEHRGVPCHLAGGLPRSRRRQAPLRSLLRIRGQAPRVCGTVSRGQPWWAVVTWRLPRLASLVLAWPSWERDGKACSRPGL